MLELFQILTDPKNDFSFPTWVQIVVISLYLLCLSVLSLYAFMQIRLIRNYLKNPSRKINRIEDPSDLPFVTVQLPMFNEFYVAERIIDHVAHFNYPKDKLQIQVLDDSTDETLEIVQKKVQALKDDGVDISLIHRTDRKGYKAGALKEAMHSVKGEFIAIFDADFIPDPNFLRDALSVFQDQKVGVVQSHWGHLNKEHSLLTKLQAFGLDGHFSIEQHGRNSGGHFINFNGTAGIWRKACIEPREEGK